MHVTSIKKIMHIHVCMYVCRKVLPQKLLTVYHYLFSMRYTCTCYNFYCTNRRVHTDCSIPVHKTGQRSLQPIMLENEACGVDSRKRIEMSSNTAYDTYHQLQRGDQPDTSGGDNDPTYDSIEP